MCGYLRAAVCVHVCVYVHTHLDYINMAAAGDEAGGGGGGGSPGLTSHATMVEVEEDVMRQVETRHRAFFCQTVTTFLAAPLPVSDRYQCVRAYGSVFAFV